MPLAPIRARTAQVTARVAVLAVLLAGCSGTSDTEASGDGAKDAAPPVVQPGEPGEPAREVDPETVEVDDSWNHADVAFLQMMIPHHAQALEMADLAELRASSPAVRSLAERIRAAQAPEILVMAGWLHEREMPVPRAAEDPASYDHAQHGHHGMAGMLTAEQMRRLTKARGPEFDRLFLRGMIAHHQGALTMAENVATTGADLRVSELAADVSASQAAEIDRMESLLGSR